MLNDSHFFWHLFYKFITLSYKLSLGKVTRSDTWRYLICDNRQQKPPSQCVKLTDVEDSGAFLL